MSQEASMLQSKAQLLKAAGVNGEAKLTVPELYRQRDPKMSGLYSKKQQDSDPRFWADLSPEP